MNSLDLDLKKKIAYIPYIGNAAYCYANTTSMLLAYNNVSISPSYIEVLTGVGLSATLNKKKGFLYFNNQTLLPDLGIGKTLEMLGFNYKQVVSNDKASFNSPLENLKNTLTKSPVILGPLDMGYLTYNPRHKYLYGADHFVLAYDITDVEILLHDPAGFPHASLPLKQLKESWKAEKIGYRVGYYRSTSLLKRKEHPEPREIYRRAINFFRSIYETGEKRTPNSQYLTGIKAIEYVINQIKKDGLTEKQIEHFMYFALPLGAKRALDYAIFLKPYNQKLAELKIKQSYLFGKSHTLLMRKNSEDLINIFHELAQTEDMFRYQLLLRYV